MIWICRVSAIRIRDPDQRGADDLDDCCDDVAGDEYPEYELGAQRRVRCAVGRVVDEDGEHGVDGRCEEDRGHDDEEVLDYEEGDFVGVAFCAEGAGDVADDLLQGRQYATRRVIMYRALEVETMCMMKVDVQRRFQPWWCRSTTFDT